MDDADPRMLIERLCRDRNEDFAGLSRMLGRNPSYVQQFVRRGSPRRLAERDRAVLAAYLGVTQQALGGPAAAVATAPASMRTVPMLDVGASAGPGAEVGGEAALIGMAFDERMLRMLAAGDPDRLSLIRVAGESMAPTLADGDVIMVDRGAAAGSFRDGIHVLRIDDMLMVKRVAVRAGGRRLFVTSDNPHAPDPGDRPAAAVTVIGRVIWSGGRVA